MWLWGRSAGRYEARRLNEGRTPGHLLAGDDELGATVRMLMQDRMRRHAAVAERLWEAFVAADYTTIASHANELAGEPRLRELGPNESPSLLNAGIPREFFAYQNELERGALALADAAASANAAGVITAFQRTSASCFSCHVHYRMGARRSAAAQLPR